MSYFLDANNCIFFINGNHQAIRRKILATPPSEILIPSVVAGELYFGAGKSGRREENMRRAREFLSDFEIVEYDDEAAQVYGKIRANLERRGTPLPVNYYFIAAIVISRNGTLVTDDGHFAKIAGLKIENWA
ncbi:MAG: type II toxin-antitoxin system VapC family toxin [Planctomycetota bacterium]|jgi:tRNA(fMet)-specific endonuclease VapC|nr:type II toxin-antitoxin system VapC family toxin [Planctomycetota bacterium]